MNMSIVPSFKIVTEVQYAPGTLMQSRSRDILYCSCGYQMVYDGTIHGGMYRHVCSGGPDLANALYMEKVYPTDWSEYK